MKKLIIIFFIFLFSTLSFISSGVIDSIDGFLYLAVARNIYYKGEPVAPDYKYDTRENIHMNIFKGADGKTYSLTGLGFSLAFIPAVFVTDMVYKIYGVAPPVNFPLENDWLILLTASFTNAFFGAMLGCVMLMFFVYLGLKKRIAIFLSLISIFATNLLPYTKHSLAHMMFISFLMLSFLMIKRYSIDKKVTNLLFAGLSFGAVSITYNATFGLAIFPLAFYFLLLNKPKKSRAYAKETLKNLTVFLIGVLPFFLTSIWFENVRAMETYNGARDIAGVGLTYLTYTLPISVFAEGIYGQLFSSGRSIFIYTPLLLVPLIFWHKIRKSFYPETAVFIFYFLILVIFYSKAYSIGRPDQGVAGLWHGESSWGPRYLTPVLPLGMLVVGSIYKRISKKALYLVFYPLVIVGLYVQLLGVLMPYQTKFAGLEPSFYINGTEYTSYAYSNLLPRHMPVLAQSRNLFKMAKDFPSTFQAGPNNIKFYDGIDFPFFAGSEKWRVVEDKGFISFDNPEYSKISTISFNLINHPLETASYSAVLNFNLNGKDLLDKDEVLSPSQEKVINLKIDGNLLKEKNNNLIINSHFESKDGINISSGSYTDDPKNYTNKTVQPKKYIPQILSIKSMSVNDRNVNLYRLNIPYVSALGPKMTSIQYQNWGGTNQDPWKTWNIHTQTFEKLPDLWWLRNLYYWDIPKKIIIALLLLNISLVVYSGHKLRQHVLNA